MKLNLFANRRVIGLFSILLKITRNAILLFGTVVVLASCVSTLTPQPQPTAPSLYEDPFAYCAAVGTIDKPTERYTGTEMPDAIIQGMIEQEVVSADAPLEFQRNAVWRCMNNQVWVCHFGANLPCLEKADISQAPTPVLEDFCQENPNAESIPAVVTGRATVYEWGCKDEKPEVIKQLFNSDTEGYLADFWYELTQK